MPAWLFESSSMTGRFSRGATGNEKPLKGRDKGRYSVRVTGNWRLTFAWEDGDAVAVDLEDYH